MKEISFHKISEVANMCRIEEKVILKFIDETWISPFDQMQLILDDEDVERIKLIKELIDLGVNDEALPIILHLIDQLNFMRQSQIFH